MADTLKVKQRRNNALTLEQRLDVIQMSANGKSQREIADHFAVGKTQVQNTLKRKAEIEAEFKNGSPLNKKKNSKPTGNEQINSLVHKWYIDAALQNMKITGPMLQQKAIQYAAELGVSNFAASNGWLQCFIKRNNLAIGKLSGEPLDFVAAWKQKLPRLAEGHAEEDIFCLDEIGLFFKTLEDKSLYKKGEKCVNGKRSKERITVLLCANLIGEKEELLVIGKHEKPKAFGSISFNDLPVVYRHSPKALMTTQIFMDWLISFNEKMKQQKRNVILFLDSAPVHANIYYTNVKLQFFPQVTMSVLQPFDLGVTELVKLRYRKAQFRYIMSEMEADGSKTASELMSGVNMLNATHWIAAAWGEINPSTITRCYCKAGFRSTTDITPEEQIDILEDFNTLSQNLIGVNFDELATIDEELCTCDSQLLDFSNLTNDANLYFPNFSAKTEENDSDEDETELEGNIEPDVGQWEAFSALNTLRNFLQQRCNSVALQHLTVVEEEILDMRHHAQEEPSTDFIQTEDQHTVGQNMQQDFARTT